MRKILLNKRLTLLVGAAAAVALGFGVAYALSSSESRSFVFPVDQTVTLPDGSAAHLSGGLTVDASVPLPPPVTVTETVTVTDTTPTVTDTTPTTTTTTTDTTPTPTPGAVSVSTTGNDSTCGRGNGIACATFQRAYTVAQRGDTVTVEAGTYPAQAMGYLAAKDTGSGRVVFQASGAVTVNGDLASGRSGGSVTVPTGAKHVELHDMAVKGEVSLKWGSDDWVVANVDAGNVRLTSVKDIQVLGGDFGPWVDQVATINSAGGSAPGVSNILIDGARFHDYLISDPAKHSECMQVWPGAASSNVVIRNSTFRNCTDFGVLVKAPSLSGMVFDTVDMDAPMPGNVATVTCNPDCPRGGSSIRFSSYAYPGGVVKDSTLGGGLSIDVPGYVTVTNTTTG